ncbi:MAG: hypothetical protein Q9187_006331 [Circinaria calcarea]
MKAFSGDTCFVAAAALSSDVAGTAAFSPLVLSQRRVSRHGIAEEERPATRDPTTVMPVPQAREMLVEGSMKRRDSKGRMLMGAPPHELPATKSGRVGCVSDRRRQPGQQLDQPAGGALNKSTKVEREGRLEAGKPVSGLALRRCGPGSGGAASQQGRPAGGKQEKREE